MKNWRKILVVGMVAGMVAVTGCSSSIPETNQGNRNGQRVVDAVNRRTDSYGTRYNTGPRTLRGFNRGFRRAARNDRHIGTRNMGTRHTGTRHLGNRSNNHVAHPGPGIGGNSAYRHHGINTGTARQTPSNNTGTFNRGRVGHTFGYDDYGFTTGMDYEYGGYDLGMRANSRVNTAQNNAAHLNNRVVRSTPARSAATPNRSTTGTSTPRKANANKTGVTRSTGIKRNTEANVTRSNNTTNNATTKTAQTERKVTPVKTVPPTQNTTRSTQATRNTQPMLHNTNNNVAAPSARATTKRQSARKSVRTEKARSMYQNRSARRNALRNTGGSRHLNANRPYNVGTSDFNHAERGLNTDMRLNTNMRYDISNNGYMGGVGHAVPVSATDDTGDLAFFKRNKTNNEEAPVTPAPPAIPQTPERIRRANPAPAVPAPAPAPASPAPTSMAYNGEHDVYNNDNIHDLDDTTGNDYYNNDHHNNDYNNGNNVNAIPSPVNNIHAPRINQRAMK